MRSRAWRCGRSGCARTSSSCGTSSPSPSSLRTWARRELSSIAPCHATGRDRERGGRVHPGGTRRCPRRRPLQFAWHDEHHVGRAGDGAFGALPGLALRHPRTRRIARAARSVLDRRSSAATCSLCSTGSRLERVSFCGLSIGGMTGMWLGANAPERIDRLAICCTGLQLPAAEMWTERAALVRREGMASVVDATIERWFTPGVPRAESRRGGERSARSSLTTDPEGYAGCCEALADFDMRGRARRRRGPDARDRRRGRPGRHARARGRDRRRDRGLAARRPARGPPPGGGRAGRGGHPGARAASSSVEGRG